MDSLLLKVENRNLNKLKDLVNHGADVKTCGNFSLNGQKRFVEVPTLFAATILDQHSITDFFVR